MNKRFKEKRQTGMPIKDQRHLRNTLSNCLHWKVKFQGRQQSHASNGKRKYLGM